MLLTDGAMSDVSDQAGERIASEYSVPLLGALPLSLGIRENSDAGTPIVAVDPDGEVAAMYATIARNVMTQLPVDEAALPFPEIVINND